MNAFNYNIGLIDAKLIQKCLEKKGFNSQDEMFQYYLKGILGEKYEENDSEKNIAMGISFAREHCYRNLGDLLSKYISKDLRPDDEICRNCDNIIGDDGFCAYRLVCVKENDKGCEKWKKKEASLSWQNDFSGKKQPTPVIPSEKSAKILEDNENNYDLPTKDELNNLLNAIVIGSECNDKNGDAVKISSFGNKESDTERFVEIAKYLKKIWLTTIDKGRFATNACLDKNTDDYIKKYINKLIYPWITQKKQEAFNYISHPENVNELLINFSNAVISYITSELPYYEFFKIVENYIDKADYPEIVKKL